MFNDLCVSSKAILFFRLSFVINRWKVRVEFFEASSPQRNPVWKCVKLFSQRLPTRSLLVHRRTHPNVLQMGAHNSSSAVINVAGRSVALWCPSGDYYCCRKIADPPPPGETDHRLRTTPGEGRIGSSGCRNGHESRSSSADSGEKSA